MTTPPLQLTNSERDRIIEQHTDYVRKLAARVRRDIGTDLDLDELVGYGMRGLVEAANRFDPQRGIAFTTFSYYRIRGAIFDGLRELGWLSRSQYARYQAASNELLQSAADRPAPPAPQSQEVQATQAANDLTTTLDQLALVFITSLDETKAAVPDDRGPGTQETLEAKDASTQLRQAVAQLPERERQLIEAYYFNEMTLESAGKRIGLSKSWACRLHARAIKRLADLLDPSLGD